LAEPNALNIYCCNINNGRYFQWKIYEGKRKIHMKMAMMRKWEGKHKCHIKNVTQESKKEKRNFIRALHPT